MDKLGIYIHIPFCIKKCFYCDFCSYPNQNTAVMTAYTAELCRRMEAFAKQYADRKTVDTVYFGGGTPTLLPIECFEKLFETLSQTFDVTADAEITVEANPASISEKKLGELRRLGVNRISIGLQSANEKELSVLGRVHSYNDFCNIFRNARATGFDNISVDVMYGIPQQTLESFEQTLRKVLSFYPEHISAYGLKIEKGTVFSRCKDRLEFPDEDAEYAMYCLCEKMLGESGYNRYEISNFARPGRESKHNLRYWRLEDYIGFGVAAHSFFMGERSGNSRDIEAFLSGADITEEKTLISDDERITEFIMLGLRLEEGLDTLEYRRLTGRDFKETHSAVDRFIEYGFLREKCGRIGFTTKGFFVSNSVLCDILYTE